MLYLIYYENKCKNNRLEIPIYCTDNEDTKKQNCWYLCQTKYWI